MFDSQVNETNLHSLTPLHIAAAQGGTDLNFCYDFRSLGKSEKTLSQIGVTERSQNEASDFHGPTLARISVLSLFGEGPGRREAEGVTLRVFCRAWTRHEMQDGQSLFTETWSLKGQQQTHSA